MLRRLGRVFVPALLLLPHTAAQQKGRQMREEHPQIWTEECTASGCSFSSSSLVLDANWRWLNKRGNTCYFENNNTWDPFYCPDPVACAEICGVDGADYAGAYGVSMNPLGDGVTMKYATESRYSKKSGSRLFVMDTETTYKLYKLKNREFTLTVDASKLACGLNGAAYFVEMNRTGFYDHRANNAGAEYGTGYCDARCPRDVRFINGVANPDGAQGACCAEMDIWEANNMAAAFTAHPCKGSGLTKCEGSSCGDVDGKGERKDSTCDREGCGFNSFRLGQQDFYGPGGNFKVNTERPITVVTQFLTADGTDTGDLSEIRRFYMQDDKVIQNSHATILGPGGGSSISDGLCSAQKSLFGEPVGFAGTETLKEMGKALDRGMVLVLSLSDDSKGSMLWLDSAYPASAGKTNQSSLKPGVLRGPCPGGNESSPAYLRATYPEAQVEFSTIKVGTIGSTAEMKTSRRLSVHV